MTDRGDEQGQPAKGGRAAERLEEFLKERFPGGLPPEESPLEELPDEEREETETPDDGS